MPWPGGMKSYIVFVRSINWYIRVLAEMCRASTASACKSKKGGEQSGGEGR